MQPTANDAGNAAGAYVSPESSLANLAEYQLLNKNVEAMKLQKKMTVGQNLPTLAIGAGFNYHNLLEAQLLYQQTLDRRTEAFAELQNKLLEYRQATGQ